MSSGQNKHIIQDAFTAWANGDGMAFFNLLADTATWTVMGSCPISGTYVGRQRLVEDALTPQREKLAGPPTPTVTNLIAEGDTVVIQWVGKGTTKTGWPYNNSYCYVVQTMGKLLEGQPTSIPNWSVRSGSAVVSLTADEGARERGRMRPRRFSILSNLSAPGASHN